MRIASLLALAGLGLSLKLAAPHPVGERKLRRLDGSGHRRHQLPFGVWRGRRPWWFLRGHGARCHGLNLCAAE